MTSGGKVSRVAHFRYPDYIYTSPSSGGRLSMISTMARSADLTISFVITTLLLVVLRVADVSAMCESPQYAEYGHQGIINCNFIPGFTGVYWYMSVNTGYQILIRLEQQEDGTMDRSGDGYTEGKYDILSNGTLVISNIANYHNQSFKVVHVDKNLRVEERYIDLLTTVFPDLKFPLINLCNKNKLCLIEEVDFSTLACSYNHSRPPVELTWYRQSHEGTNKVEGETLISKDGEWTFSSTLNVNITSLINGPLIAFTCRASSPALNSHVFENTVIIDTTKQPWPSLQESNSEEEYFLINSEAEVRCNDIAKPFIFVWKDVGLHRGTSHILAFATNVTGSVGDLGTIWSITQDGSLVIPNISFENEGLYSCTFFDGTRYFSNVKQVNVFVPPMPPTIIANGCSKDKDECDIFAQDTTSPINISCHLFGVYPSLTPNMDSFLHPDIEIISQNTYSLRRGDYYDTTITTEFSPIDCSTSINVTCFLPSPQSLTFIQDKVIVVRSEECETPGSKVAVIVLAVFIVVVIGLGILLFSFYSYRRIQRSRKDIEKGHSHEFEPLQTDSQENGGDTQTTVMYD